MAKLSSKFSAADRGRVESAIASAEQQTSAEIVVVAAAASGRYDRPEDMTGLVVATILLVLLWTYVPEEFHFGGVITTLFVGFFAGVGLAMLAPPLRRLLTPRAEMLQETTRAAESHFYRLEMRRSASRCGVLLYVSFFEHTASVIADHAALDALGREGVQGLCDELTAALKSAPPAEAMARVVELAGQRLGEKLPRDPDDTDELLNQFIILD